MSKNILDESMLELRIENGNFGLSARRIWEHTEMGQANVFSKSISSKSEINDVEAYIDIIKFNGNTFSVTGLTVADLRNEDINIDAKISKNELKTLFSDFNSINEYICIVRRHIDCCAVRQAIRNQGIPFLIPTVDPNIFGIPLIYSALKNRLKNSFNFKATSLQWINTIANFQKNGVRFEEIESSQLIFRLDSDYKSNSRILGSELLDLCDFKDLRISVIPVTNNAQVQLSFRRSTETSLTRTKITGNSSALPRSLVNFDPVLGYRIEQVEHISLWGVEYTWQAVTFDGEILSDATNQTGFQNEDLAIAVANSHAQIHFPKRCMLGKFSVHAWTGGMDYREWLITLPYYSQTYLSGHFNIRNVLAHVRCDIRIGADGEHVLMLQEVQSDWAQRARRAVSVGESSEDDEVPPPFMKEWPALVMKLMVLHACQRGLDAVAWTKGEQQVGRWNGLGGTGLIDLYDRTLPKNVTKLMKQFGSACETLGVFVPTNFSIKQTELGYEVLSELGELLGVAQNVEDARVFVPDEGHEVLIDVHGVRLPVALRIEILNRGFAAWG